MCAAHKSFNNYKTKRTVYQNTIFEKVELWSAILKKVIRITRPYVIRSSVSQSRGATVIAISP